MTVSTNANIHFDEGDVHHRWFPGSDECHAYGALKFGEGATVFFDRAAEIDAVIAELVALRAEMDPPPAGEGGVLFPAGDEDEGGPMDDEAELRRAEEIPDAATPEPTVAERARRGARKAAALREAGELSPLPVAAADAPCSSDAATVLAESIAAGTPLLVTDDEDAAVSA